MTIMAIYYQQSPGGMMNYLQSLEKEKAYHLLLNNLILLMVKIVLIMINLISSFFIYSTLIL